MQVFHYSFLTFSRFYLLSIFLYTYLHFLSIRQMDLTALKIRYVDVLKNAYGFIDIISFNTLPGGYLEEETWLVHLGSDERYVVKTIHYPYSSIDLEIVLTFQNYLHSNVNYPCSRIVSTLMSKLFVPIENDRYVFVQTFIDGHPP